MTDKTILTDRYQFTDESVRLHPGTRTDSGAFLNLGKRPNEAIIPDFAAV